MAKFLLEIVTPDREFFKEEVDMVVVRGIEGDLAVLANMAPLATPLKICKVRIFQDKVERIAAALDGYITVIDNKATIVTDAAEWPEEIDLKRAEEAKKRAEERLRKQSDKIDTARAEVALKRAINRLEVGNLRKND